MRDTYSATLKGYRYTSKANASLEYLGRDPVDGDVVVLYVHSGIINKSFLKSFDVRVSSDSKQAS